MLHARKLYEMFHHGYTLIDPSPNFYSLMNDTTLHGNETATIELHIWKTFFRVKTQFLSK